MRTLLVLCMAAGCGQVNIAIQEEPCTDVDLEADPAIRVEREGDDVVIQKLPVFRGSDDEFNPRLEFSGRQIEVFEDWTEAGGESFCLAPTIRMIDPPPGAYQILWYDDATAIIPDYNQSFEL